MDELKRLDSHEFELEYFDVARVNPTDALTTPERILSLNTAQGSDWIVIKDVRRTYVAEFSLAEPVSHRRHILKIPRARNRRQWERLLTLFRPPDVIRSLRSMELASQLGVLATRPMVAGVRRQFGMVTHSFMVYEKLEGQPPVTSKDIKKVCQMLTALHQRGWLRRDALLRNFVLTTDGEVGLIDFRLSRPYLWKRARQGLECDKLIGSAAEAEQYLDTSYRSLVSYRCLVSVFRLKLAFKRYKERLRRQSIQ